MLFYHVMSQLTIVLTNNSDAPVTGVTVGGLVPTAVVDFTVPSAAAKSGAAAADVEAFEVTADAALPCHPCAAAGHPDGYGSDR